MSSDSLFDIPSLLAPISEEAPTGPDMLLSLEFDEIQRAREYEDTSLDQGEWVTDRKEADFPRIIQRCTELLEQRTKDLRLAIWLTEAAASLFALRGITDGYRLLTALCETYWNAMHPEAEDGDMDARTGNIGWLLNRTAELLRSTPLLTTSGGTISLQAWQAAVALDQAIRRMPSEADEIQRGKVTLDELERIKSAASAAQLRDLLEALSACQQAIAGFEAVLLARLSDEAPSFGHVKETLADMLHLARRFAADNGVSLEPSAAADQAGDHAAGLPHHDGEPTPGHVARPAASIPAGELRSRAEAIALLQKVARFFEKTEPSSPAAYMAQKAATWAQLPLHEWLKHVIKSDDELAQLEEMLGITRNPRVRSEE